MDRRKVYSVVGSTFVYILSTSPLASALTGLSIYALYLPVPLNVDNFFATFVLLKSLSIGDTIGRLKVRFGVCSELERRRNGLDKIKPKIVPGVTVESKSLGDFDLFIFKPAKIQSKGAVMFYHGGGFTVMHVYSYQRYLSYMASQLGCIVFSPEYRLAPESPWPTGDEDVHKATRYVYENHSEFGIDPAKVILTGDSAGGFLTFVTWYRMRDYWQKENIKPALLSLIYPALGYRFDTPSYQRNMNMPFLSMDDVFFYYISHGGWINTKIKNDLLRENLHVDEDKLSAGFKHKLDPEKWLEKDELIDWEPPVFRTKSLNKEEKSMQDEIMTYIENVTFTPLSIDDNELLEIPPVVTYVCEYDVLKNDGQMLHSRLMHLGKKSTLVELKGAFHAQIMFARQFIGLKAFKKTTAAFDGYIDFMKPYLE